MTKMELFKWNWEILNYWQGDMPTALLVLQEKHPGCVIIERRRDGKQWQFFTHTNRYRPKKSGHFHSELLQMECLHQFLEKHIREGRPEYQIDSPEKQ